MTKKQRQYRKRKRKAREGKYHDAFSRGKKRVIDVSKKRRIDYSFFW